MDDIQNKAVPIDAATIQKLIDQTQWGDYDQYHDWSPAYSLSDKLTYLTGMLQNWDNTTPEAKKLIMEFVKMLKKESGRNTQALADTLTKFDKKLE